MTARSLLSRAAARRAAVAVVLVGGLLGVTACQSHIGTAAYVGKTRITDTQVDGLVTDALAQTSQQPTDDQLATLRQNELTRLILEIGFTRLDSGRGLSEPTDSEITTFLEQTRSGGQSVSTTSTADRLAAAINLQASALAKVLSQSVKLTETDLQRAYVASGAQSQGYSYAQVRSQLAPLAYQELAVREAAQAAAKLGVTVNPRYGSFDAQNLVTSSSDDFVKVEPTASPSASSSNG